MEPSEPRYIDTGLVEPLTGETDPQHDPHLKIELGVRATEIPQIDARGISRDPDGDEPIDDDQVYRDPRHTEWNRLLG